MAGSIVFCVYAVLASFGMGSSVQAYSIRRRLKSLFPFHRIWSYHDGSAGRRYYDRRQTNDRKGLHMACSVYEHFVSGGCLWLIVKNKELLPQTVAVIFRTAFCGEAAVGGAAGGAVMTAVRVGVARGLFTNEAGLGSIPMAAASSGSRDAVRQGLVSMTGPFWDTVVMCAVTGVPTRGKYAGKSRVLCGDLSR